MYREVVVVVVSSPCGRPNIGDAETNTVQLALMLSQVNVGFDVFIPSEKSFHL